MTDSTLCSNCNHPKDKHAFDVVISDRKNPCELSCMICFDLETERLKQDKQSWILNMMFVKVNYTIQKSISKKKEKP